MTRTMMTCRCIVNVKLKIPVRKTDVIQVENVMTSIRIPQLCRSTSICGA
jgi:hypothetical protein